MIQKPRGTQDLFLSDSKEIAFINEKFRKVTDIFNYSEIITPIFESKELFLRSVGDTSDIVSKEMYEFTDRKGREFVLKPEGTAPTVRALIENKLYLPENLPFKSFYISPIFRYERPQAGRYRQFTQFGVEVFGYDSINHDIEIINLANTFLNELKIEKDVLIEINFLINGDERKKYEDALRNYLNNFNDICDDCKKRINKNVLRVLDCKIDSKKFIDAPLMFDYASDENINRINKTKQMLIDMNLNVVINKKLVRGLDYYTGFVFEFINEKTSQAILAGGSYNNLVKELGGPDLPASGFAIGLERIVSILKENNIKPKVDDDLDLFIIPLNDEAKTKTNKLMNELRSNDIKVDTNWNINNLKQGFKYAERNKAKNIVIIGKESIENNLYSIKPQDGSDLIECKFEEIINIFKK